MSRGVACLTAGRLSWQNLLDSATPQLNDSTNGDLMSYELKDKCGVFGIFGHKEAAYLTYLGLYSLQHRGEESAGIVVSDGKKMSAHRGMGHVQDVFDSVKLETLKGDRAIGHVRYSTTGSSNLK